MANTPQEIDTNKLRADPRVIDQLNQAVIKEFRANQGKVVGLFGRNVFKLSLVNSISSGSHFCC